MCRIYFELKNIRIAVLKMNSLTWNGCGIQGPARVLCIWREFPKIREFDIQDLVQKKCKFHCSFCAHASYVYFTQAKLNVYSVFQLNNRLHTWTLSQFAMKVFCSEGIPRTNLAFKRVIDNGGILSLALQITLYWKFGWRGKEYVPSDD